MRTKTPKPTDAELAILRVLWERGPSTVREVHEALRPTHETGYTTILKLMQIMVEKDLLSRDERDRAHVYHARFSSDVTQRQLVDDLLARAFDGSPSQLVMRVLSSKSATQGELLEIRRMLDTLEGEK